MLERGESYKGRGLRLNSIQFFRMCKMKLKVTFLGVVFLVCMLMTSSVVAKSNLALQWKTAGGKGIGFQYFLDGGLYVGGMVGTNQSDSTSTGGTVTKTSTTSINPWVGYRTPLSDSTYLTMGVDYTTTSGKESDIKIDSASEIAPWIGVHHYLSERLYVSSFVYPIVIATKELENKSKVESTNYLQGFLGVGFHL